MPTEDNPSAPDGATLEDLRAGRCPDGGGPQCVCKLIKKPGACVSLSAVPKCTTCDDDGKFRIGMFTDVCGDCLGSKLTGSAFAAWVEGEKS